MCGVCILFFCFFKQKTAYEMRISDWSSDVCSSDLYPAFRVERGGVAGVRRARRQRHTASGAVARTLTALALTNEKGRGITAALSFVLEPSLSSGEACD